MGAPQPRRAGPVRDRAIAISSMSSFPMTKSTTSGGAAMMLPRALSRSAGLALSTRRREQLLAAPRSGRL
jgi:hypothetical protein